MRMDVAAMHPALGQNVDPDILKNQCLAIKIKFQILREGCHMLVQRSNRIREYRKPPRQIGQ